MQSDKLEHELSELIDELLAQTPPVELPTPRTRIMYDLTTGMPILLPQNRRERCSCGKVVNP